MAQDIPFRVFARRDAPAEVPAVHAGGLRFEQTQLSRKEADGGQRLGYLGAYKGESNELLWRVRVYEIHYRPELEGDVQDVFFTAMRLSDDGRQILVDNEDDEHFAVDIDGDHAVHARA